MEIWEIYRKHRLRSWCLNLEEIIERREIWDTCAERMEHMVGFLQCGAVPKRGHQITSWTLREVLFELWRCYSRERACKSLPNASYKERRTRSRIAADHSFVKVKPRALAAFPNF